MSNPLTPVDDVGNETGLNDVPIEPVHPGGWIAPNVVNIPATADSAYQQLLLEELGQYDNPILSYTLQTLIWPLYADKAVIGPRIQYLWALLKCLDWLDGQPGPGEAADQAEITAFGAEVKRRSVLRATAMAELALGETRARDNRIGCVGAPLTTSPIPYPQVWNRTVTALPNPNNRGYRGDPTRPSFPFGRGRGF